MFLRPFVLHWTVLFAENILPRFILVETDSKNVKMETEEHGFDYMIDSNYDAEERKLQELILSW